MIPKNFRFVARLLAVLLLLQPLLGVVGGWEIASAATAPNNTVTAVNEAEDEPALMTALTNGEQAGDLDLPDNFSSWSQDDLSDAMDFIKGFFQPSEDNLYESLAQIQFKLDVLGLLFESRNDVSMGGISGKINQILSLSSGIETLFPNSPDVAYLKEMADHIAAMSPADRQIYDTFIQNQAAMALTGEEYSPLLLVMLIFQPEGQVPGFSQPESAEEMIYVIWGLMDYLGDLADFKSEYPNAPLADMGLDFSKAITLGDPEADEGAQVKWMALGQWMIDQRPEAGYASVAAIQSNFDNFFTLRVVNEAIENQDVEGLLDALIDEDLGLTLPDDFESWITELKMSWAATVMNLFGSGSPSEGSRMYYDNLAQLQYVSDLAAIPVKLLDNQSFTSMSDVIDAAFAKLGGLETVFPEYEPAQMATQMNEAYDALTPVEKYIYKYTLYITFTTLINEEPPANGNGGENGNGSGVGTGSMLTFLLGSFSFYPQVAINSVTTPEGMTSSLGILFQQIQKTYESFKQTHPDIDIEEWNLDLSKMESLNPEDEITAELSSWMLDKRPEGGYADLAAIQSTFNQFFTPAAPSVTADDNADKLVGADATMEYSTDNGTTWKSYDPENAPVFSGYVTVLVRVKENGVRTASPTTSVSFNAPYVYVPSNNTETRYVDVQGSDGSGLARTPVTRTTDASGKVTDSVTLSSDIAKEAVDKAKAQGGSTVRIAIPDAEDKVSEVSVTIPAAALTQINDGKMNLELSTGDGIVSIPTASLSGFGQDLYFRLVPVKSEDGRVQVETRAKQEKAVQDYAKDESIKIYGRPMQIETNLQSREVSLFLPLKNGLPTDAAERDRIMNHLGVYAEHSDGTKELIQGKVVTMNNMTGIQFTVKKFSTFAIVYADGLNGTTTPTTTTHTPYINGFGTDFRPNAFVTRAQMAAMLARNLPDTTVSAGTTAGSDVKAGHWAMDEILKAKSAGIMGGVSETMFDPEGSVTRAQMAAIAARWMQKGPTTSQGVENPGNGNYSDVSDSHWAADAISYVTSAGIMTGYAGQTFKPDQKLTRAEAVKVLNRLFGRGPLNGATTVTFTDVPATHWAFADIEEAATNHKYTVDAQGAEHIAAQ